MIYFSNVLVVWLIVNFTILIKRVKKLLINFMLILVKRSNLVTLNISDV